MGLARLLAGACLAAGAAVMGALPASADEQPQRYNCPEGFVWIRMSGTGCVQEKLPPNGKTGYDGHPLCIDGFVGIYETRPTTDGRGVPGNPQATSFGYLLECVTQKEFDARQSRVADPPALGDAASRLASEGTVLPPGQLLVLGALGSGALVFAAWQRRPGLPASPPAVAAGAPPEPDPEPVATELDAGELRRRIEALTRIDQDLARQMDHYRAAADAGRLTPQDVVTWAGIIANVAGTIPGAQLPAGIVSLAANVAGLVGAEYDTRDLDRAIRAGLGAMAELRGTIEVELDGYRTALAEAEQPREPEVPPVPPELLPDDVLEAERAAAHQRAVDASHRAVELSHDLVETGDRLRALEGHIDGITDRLSELDPSALHDGAVDAAWWVDVAAGIDSLGRSHQASTLLQAAGQGNSLEQALELAGSLKGARAAGSAAGGISVASAAASMAEWFRSRSAEEQRVLVERAIEAMRYEAGKLRAEQHQIESAMERASAESQSEASRRTALWNEKTRRSLPGFR